MTHGVSVCVSIIMYLNKGCLLFMKVRFKSLTALAAAFALFLSIFRFDVVVAETNKLEDGTYSANFVIYSDNSDKESVMYDYSVHDSGKLIVKDGEISFQSSWKNFAWFKYLGTLEAGKTKSNPKSYAASAEYELDNYVPQDYTAATVTDTAGTTLLPIRDVSAKQELLVHVNATQVIPGYNFWYNVQLVITEYWKDGDQGGGGTEPGEQAPVNLAALEAALRDAKTFDDTVLVKGTMAGNSSIVSEGEYPPDAKNNLQSAIATAEAALETEAATQAVIDAVVVQLNRTVEEVRAQQIHGRQVKLVVLDGILPSQLSSNAEMFGEDATIFQIGTNYYANITIHNPESIYKIEEPNHAAGPRAAFQNVEDLSKLITRNFSYIMLKANKDEHTYVGQLDLRSYGMGKLRFQTSDDEATRKVVYLNFNGIELKHLQDGVAAAQKMHDSAVVGTGTGQYAEEAKEQFQLAIDAIQMTSGDYAATLTEMAAAEQKLWEAIEAFVQTQYKQAGSYTTTLVGSAPELLNYVDASGKIDVQENKYTVTFTPKSGVTIKKLIHTVTKEEFLPVGQQPKRLAVTSLSVSAALAAETPKFEISDIQSPYTIVLEKDNNGSVEELSYSIAFSDIKLEQSGSTPTPGSNSSGDTTQATVPGDSGVLKDGSYYIPYKVLKADSNEESILNHYVVQKALLKADKGAYTVFLTLKQDKEITSLSIEGKETEIVSRNESLNTRVVSFKVDDLSVLLKGHIKIVWPAMNYQHEDDIRLSFDQTGLLAAEAGSEAPGVETGVDNGSVKSFTDVEGHWAQAAIEAALKRGIVAEADKFNPNRTITRAEFAALLSRALQLPTLPGESTFADDSQIPNWAKPHVASIQKIGFIKGYADQTFRASHSITRAELAVMIARAAELETKAGAALAFADAAQVPAWAAGSVAAGVEAGLLHGKGGNRFDPSGSATRAEALTLVMKVLELR